MGLTRRKARRLHAEARRWHQNGIHWEGGYSVAAPTGPMRIAFDAGREKARSKDYTDMSLDVWVRVLADWLRSY